MAFNPLAALLAARGGAAPAPGVPGAPAGPQASGAQPNVSALIGHMIDLGTQAMTAERDPLEKEALSKIIALLHGFAAREQKQRDAAMGAGPAIQLLRRQG